MRTFEAGRNAAARLGCWILGIVAIAMVAGCVPTDGGSNGNSNDNSGSDIESKIKNIESNIALSTSSPAVSVIYDVGGDPDTVSGIAVRLNETGEEDDPQLLPNAANLPVGENQAFQFRPSDVGVGVYRVGILITTETESETVLSTGIVSVQGPPDPQFILPSAPITETVAGSSVAVSFDAGDPENVVEWRLFYLRPSDPRGVTPDQLGTQLAVGSGNVGQATFITTGLEPGDYELGVSATDSGFSVAATVQRGEADRIVTIPNSATGEQGRIIRIVEPSLPQPPTMTISAPGSANVNLFLNEAFTIQFQATIREPGAEGVVDVFYDTDTTFNNGFTIIEGGIPATRTSVALPTNLPAGTYRVGASVSDGINPVVFTYAAGSITVVRTPTLDVTAPNTDLPLAPSTPGSPSAVTIPVTWTTNVPPASTRTVDVFARTLDAAGSATGPEIQVMPASPLTVTSTTFARNTSGVYAIFVRISFTNGESPTLIDQSPKPVRVSALPRILWLGSLAQTQPSFEGAIFEGANFEDNAGTAFASAGDLNGDSLEDFVISARYAKPFFLNPSGVGHGEAYIIYGRSGPSKLRGAFNLNSVGLTGLRGLTLLGIPTVENSDDTDGLSAVTRIPDSDGDGASELVFGFPRTDSRGGDFGLLEADGQFLNGGVVILSSNNSLLENPDSGQPVIDLGSVGQSFGNTTIQPAPNTTILDQLAFDPGDPNATPPRPAGCIAGTDGIPETVVGPSSGFISLLAPPGYELAGIELIPANTPPGPGRCPTRFLVPTECFADGVLVLDNVEPGSGFYPTGSVVIEPLGARIIGKDRGDAFGTSVTVSIPIGTTGPGQLIVSAPLRSADPSEITGIGGTLSNSGLAYITGNSNRWPVSGALPKPFQYVVGTASHCGAGVGPNIGATEIAGDSGDAIQNVLGIEDFNRDGRNDIAVGAPNADEGKGRVYVAFRRDTAIEGDVLLNKLELAPTNPERLTGVLFTSEAADGLGTSLASGVDFNNDGIFDLVIGSPNAGGGVGEVVVVFGDSSLTSGEGGLKVQDLLRMRTASGAPRAARIKGNPDDANGRFGFNIANAGDVDGDGKNDLLIAAPNATPRFDPMPTDATDTLSERGVDLNFDGVQDDVTGPLGIPDGVVNDRDDLAEAGIVYLISSRNVLSNIAGTDVTIDIKSLGRENLRGFMIVGRREGDRIGGGDAGDVAAGGIATKVGRGRSQGLGSAGDVDGDRRDDILVGSILADPRRDPNSGVGILNGGEAYLIYGSASP